MTIELPASCKYGMTPEDLASIFTKDELKDLDYWMRGQTCTLCEGRKWSYEKKEYVSDDCGPHGMVMYRHDVERFILGLPVID